MLKQLFFLLLAAASTPLFACDACGCGIGGGGFGLLSVYRNNFVGLSYQHLPFRSRLTSGEYTGTEDAFHQAELQLRYEALPGWRVDAFLPYRSNLRRSPDGDESLSGLGDVRLGAAYILADNRAIGSNGVSWYWELGGVLSLPTGSYDADLLDNRFLPDNFNLGRGAMGYGLQTALVFSTGSYGLALNARRTTYAKSNDHYRFGAETALGAQVFGQLSYDPHWKIIPFAGVSYERTDANKTVDDLPVHATGGTAWLATAGVNVRYDDFTLGLRAGLPLSQKFSDGMAEAGTTSSVQVFYNF